MKNRHKKLLISGTAAAMAGILGAGAFFHSSIAVQASASMMPGIETIVKNSTKEKPFRILELVDNSEDAEIGYYVSGQEPFVKLYEYQYQDAEGNTQSVHFSSVEEGLKRLPEKYRMEFAMNVKLNEDGSVNTEASTGIRKISDIADTSGDKDATSGSPLSYSDYQEKYFLSDGESEEDGWKELDLENFDGSSRTDTVQLQGTYVENGSDSGNYTKQQQEYYPIRHDVEEDNARTEKYRENIQNFYYSEGDDVRGGYYLQFAEVDNETVNNALKDENDKGQKTILPEYDYSGGKYGYYENVYTDLTQEIVQNIENQIYTFPGEEPEDVSTQSNAVLIQDNSTPETASEVQDSFGDGMKKTENSQDEFAADQEEGQSTDSGEQTFEDGDPDAGDASDEMNSAGDDSGDLEFSEAEDAEESTDSFSVDSEDGSEELSVQSGTDNGDDTATEQGTAETEQSAILGEIRTPESAGSQADPYIYLGESIEQYPFYKYTLIGDLAYIKEQAGLNQQKDQSLKDQGQEPVRQAGDITFSDDQYWYWEADDAGNLNRLAVSVVTGRQPVSYSDIRSIPDEIDYNYYYKVEKVWFCCESAQDEGGSQNYKTFGWYYPSYPENEDTYLKVSDGDGKTATHYISDAEYKLTPGKGNYDFVQGEGSSCQVEVNHFYYRGGYTSHDWLKRYVFHLTDTEDEEFKNLNIQVDTKKASDFSDIYAVQNGTGTQAASRSGDAVAAEVQEQSGEETETSEEDVFTDEESGESDPQNDLESQENQSEDTVDDGLAGEDQADVQQASDTDSSGTGILADYDLIYINGTLSDTTAAYFKNSSVPCVINSQRLLAGSALESTFRAFLKDNDADGHYVNHYVYVFKNTLQSGKENNLVNTAFHQNFNPKAEEGDTGTTEDQTEGFEEILSYIESENKYRALEADQDSEDADEITDGSTQSLEPLTEEISQARALEYIINYQYKRHQKLKSSIRVLEIEPAKSSSQISANDVKQWLSEDRTVIENINVCCYHDGDGNKENLSDGDAETMWHSAYDVGKTGNTNIFDSSISESQQKSHAESTEEGKHWVEFTLKDAADIDGFYYQPRSGQYKNGVLKKYKVEFWDENGEKTEETISGETDYVRGRVDSSVKKEIPFDHTVENVKKLRITFQSTLGQETGNDNKFASCAEMGVITEQVRNIDITTMTASEFVGHVDDLVSRYDLIYIGGKKSSDSNPFITGDGDYRYVHVGSGVQVQSGDTTKELLKLLGQLDNEYDQNYTSGNGMKRFAPLNTYGPDGGGYFRGSGNDMTKQQSQELMDFVKSGYPVVISSELLDGDGQADSTKVDTASYYYSFISQALKYDNVLSSGELNSGKKDIHFFSNLAKPVIKFDENGGKPAEAAGVNEVSDDSSGTIQGELKFTFTIENDSDAAPAISTYNCNLYIDLNFDGVFSAKEKQDKYMVVQDEAGNVLSQVKYGKDDYRYELKAGQKYTVTRKIPSDYFKLITWKLEAVSNRNAYIHTSETGYSKQENTTGQKQTIRVLQLIPTNCTWNLKNSTRFNELLKDVQDFNIEIETRTVTEINGYSQSQMNTLLSDKQMLIIGFADVYQDISNQNHQVDEILKFVKAGKSILFAHDTTSYINYDWNKMYKSIASTQYGVDENTGIYYDEYLHRDNIKNVTWGLSLNTILREVTGMDRYGITSDKTLSDGMTVSQLLKQGQSLSDGSSVTFKELMEKAGDIAYKNGSQKESYGQTQGYTNNLLKQRKLGNNGTTTTTIQKINEGAITQYPYKMGDSLNIAQTHGQYYQLGLEQDCDINGNSDGKTDIVVWYTLSGSIYDESPQDARNNYYLYSKGNVIYTGAGHSTVSGDEEIKLFINAIVAAANVTAVQPEVNFVKTLNPSAETEEVHYYMTDQSHWTSGEANTLETNTDLNINVKDYNMVSADLSQEDLDNQKMTLKFYIEDENGAVLTDGEGNSLPADLRDQKLTDITAQIGTLTPYGNGEEPVTCQGDGSFHITRNNAYALTIPGIESYLRQTETDGTQDYRNSCRVWVKVTSTVYLYGEPRTSTVWSNVDLKQRQLFDLD